MIKGIAGTLWELLEAIVLAIAIGFIFQWLVIQPNQVRGISMHPTFIDRELIFTEKISYYNRNPKRGEIVVFKSPRFIYQDYIKRVIGLPGDKLMLQNGKVYLNDKQLDESSYLSENVYTGAESFLKEDVAFTVGPNSYFVMGDNRQFSSDSREFGPITKEEIIGRVVFRYWPLNKIGGIENSQTE